MSLKELIKSLIYSDGPVDFQNIKEYCLKQYPGVVKNFMIADVLNQLIQEKTVVIYDNGISFYPYIGN